MHPSNIADDTRPAHEPDDASPRPLENASISSMWRGTILDSIADGVFTVDDAWRITSFNRAAEKITGHSRQDVIGQHCYEVFRTNICHANCALHRSFLSGKPVIHVPVEAVKKDGSLLPLSISTALLRAPDGRRVGGVETFQDVSAAETPKREEISSNDLHKIVGHHPDIQRLLDILPDIAQSEATVWVHGPAGAGKGLVSRTIHALSPRRDGPYVRVCCSALPASILDREIFGGRDETGRVRAGRIRMANGGTLVLDEVTALSPSLQTKLLQLLEEGTFQSGGDAGKVERADVRVVVCSREDIADAARSGKFHQDLFDRLQAIHLRLPPLSDRREDIPRLVDWFMGQQRLRTGKDILSIAEDAMQMLTDYEFPGNVRELENAIEHAFVLCHGDQVEVRHLPASLTKGDVRFSLSGDKAIGNPRQAAEAEVIRRTLERHHGNRQQAAKELSMHRTTLWRKLKQYGILSG